MSNHKYILNAVTVATAQSLALIPQIIIIPYVIAKLGEKEYGIYALVWSLMLVIEQLEKSLQSGVVKYCAAYVALNDQEKINKLLSASFAYSLFLGVVSSLVVIALSRLYGMDNVSMSMSLVIVGVMLLFSMVLTPYIALVQSTQNYAVGAILDAVSKYIGLICTFAWFEYMYPSVVALVLIMAMVLLMSKLANMIIAKRLNPGIKIRLALADTTYLKLIVMFGAGTVLASMCLAANMAGVRWLMDYLVSTNFVTHLVIMLMPSMLMMQLINSMTMIVMPSVSSHNAKNNVESIKEVLVKGVRYSAGIVLGIIIITANILEDVIGIWLGDEYRHLAPYALVLFVGAGVMQTTSVGHHLLKGLGKIRLVVYIYFISLVIFPFAAIIVFTAIHLNPYISITIALLAGNLACAAMNLYYSAKVVNVKLKYLFACSYLGALICTGIIISLQSILIHSTDSITLIGEGAVSLFAGIVYILFWYFFIFDKMERRALNDIYKRIKYMYF